MSAGSELERVLDLYLADGPSTLPDGVMEDALDEVSHTSQRHALMPARRFTPMSPHLRIAAVGLAAVAVLVAGVVFVVGDRGAVGTGVQPSAIPSPAETAPSSPPPSAPAVSHPAGLALVGLDGRVIQDLGLPRDAWTADLSPDGAEVAFVTRSIDIGFCGPCSPPRQRVALVAVGSTEGTYALPWGDASDAEPETISSPVWSPDGTKLAYRAASPADPTNLDIWVIALDRSDPTMTTGEIVRLTTDPAEDSFPAWTPDGRTVMYDNAGSEPLDSSGFSPTQEIWAVSAVGGDPVQLTSNDEPDSQPDIRADGTVAFWRSGRIWTMAEDGGSQRMLDGVPEGFGPRWSPDGSRLALLRPDPTERALLDPSLDRGVNLPLLDVIVVHVESGEVTEVGQQVPSDVNAPSWLPDSSGLLVYRYE